MQLLVDCSGDDLQEKSPDTAFDNKKSALLQLVKEVPVPKTIVFCNKVSYQISHPCVVTISCLTVSSCLRLLPRVIWFYCRIKIRTECKLKNRKVEISCFIFLIDFFLLFVTCIVIEWKSPAIFLRQLEGK